MSSDRNSELTKDNLDLYLKAVAKEYRRLNRNGVHAEIIIVGGGAILLNYSFRVSTTDIDAYMHASSSLKEAINKVTDQYGLPNGWLNSDFTYTSSYSDKLLLHSKYYKTYYNIFDIRSVTREYLIAMKLKSGRKYKNDLSDIIGILDEHLKKNDPIRLEEIETAYRQLYGEWEELPDDILNFITSIFENKENIHNIYEATKNQEKETKSLLLHFEEDYPEVTSESNIESILNSLTKQQND